MIYRLKVEEPISTIRPHAKLPAVIHLGQWTYVINIWKALEKNKPQNKMQVLVIISTGDMVGVGYRLTNT